MEIALIAIADTTERERLQRDVVTSSRRAFELAKRRLNEGVADLVTLLQVQQTLFVAEDQRVLARQARLQAVLSLFQALGGSWLPPGVAAGRGQCERNAMTATRRTLVFLIVCLVVGGAVAAAYYMPLAPKQEVAQKSSRRGGGAQRRRRSRFRCSRSPPSRPTCRSISTASAPRARSIP